MRLNTTRHLLLVPAWLGLASFAMAQGSDSCASAQAIAGLGSFAFDNSAATLDGAPDALCYFFGNSDVENDIWFSWTAPADGIYTLDTCGTTSVDTKVSILNGLCNGAMLDCNDDACGLQSEANWAAVSGQTYMLRVGTFPGATGGTGTINISDNAPVQDPATGHSYLVVDQAGITWDAAKLAAEAMNYQGLTGHLVTISDASENAFVASLGGTHYRWIGGFQNTSSSSYAEPAGGWEWVTGEPMTFTDWNQAIPEPNNTGANGAEDYMEIIENIGGVAWSWNDADQLAHGGGFIVEFETGSGAGFCFGDGTSTACPCGNAGGSGEGCANSTAAGATLATTGSQSVAADDLGFTGGNLLPSQPALLFGGMNAVNGGAGILFGDGLRCAGGSIVRLGVRVPDAGGAASWGPALGTSGGWASGDTRRFQVWYRDPVGSPCGAGFNLSHGVELVFGP
jgi:Lectin C-type domain